MVLHQTHSHEGAAATRCTGRWALMRFLCMMLGTAPHQEVLEVLVVLFHLRLALHGAP